MPRNYQKTYTKVRFRNPKTGKYETRTEKRNIKTKNASKPKTELERVLQDPKISGKDKADIIKQNLKANKQVAMTTGAEGAALAGTNMMTNNKSAVNTGTNSSNIGQNINGGISETTNSRDDDDEVKNGFDHPGIN